MAVVDGGLGSCLKIVIGERGWEWWMGTVVGDSVLGRSLDGEWGQWLERVVLDSDWGTWLDTMVEGG